MIANFALYCICLNEYFFVLKLDNNALIFYNVIAVIF